MELAPIRVNVVAPGVARSPLWPEIPEADREAMYDSIGRRLPLGRVAEVEDVAKAYLQLMDQDYATRPIAAARCHHGCVDGGHRRAQDGSQQYPPPRAARRPTDLLGGHAQTGLRRCHGGRVGPDGGA